MVYSSTRHLFGAGGSMLRRDVVVCLSASIQIVSASNILQVMHLAAAPHAAMCLFVHRPELVLGNKDTFMEAVSHPCCCYRLSQQHVQRLLVSGGNKPDHNMWWILWIYTVFRIVEESWCATIRQCMVHPECPMVRLAALVLGNHLGLLDGDAKHLGHWGIVDTIVSGPGTGAWSLAWLLDALPTVWFPRCQRHVAAKGCGPRTLCALVIDDQSQSVKICTHGTTKIDLIACENEICVAGNQWAQAQAYHRWPHLATAITALIAGQSSLSIDDVRALPSKDECMKYLVHHHWIGHSSFPIPSDQNVVPTYNILISSSLLCPDTFVIWNGRTGSLASKRRQNSGIARQPIRRRAPCNTGRHHGSTSP
jgi:hypothetical protein